MTYQDVLDRANLGELGGVLAEIKLGTALAAIAAARLPTVETVTVADDVGHLTAAPVSIEVVTATAGDTTGVCTKVYSGTPTTKQVKVGTDGTLTFASADAVTAASVWYTPSSPAVADLLAALATDYPGY